MRHSFDFTTIGIEMELEKVCSIGLLVIDANDVVFCYPQDQIIRFVLKLLWILKRLFRTTYNELS